MRNTILALIAATLLFAGLFAVSYYTRQSKPQNDTVPIAASSTAAAHDRYATSSPKSAASTTPQSSNHSGMKLYRNEEFGFEFWYPEGWEWRENIFGSPYSKFNATLFKIDGKDTNQDEIINIVTPDFADNAAHNARIMHAVITNAEIDNVAATKYRYNFNGVPTVVLDVPLGDLRLLLSIDEKHDLAFNQILSSFKWFPPEK
ncbi:MAG: hypothetical protein AAB490_02275 [Patescibacteria group bacterium]